ncbi:hypothetical protein [Nostoc sp.]|uniref:hypothetical protein n=1 Tax=Nostoc sp. TaxID=1180 RepID=UPI002FF7147C
MQINQVIETYDQGAVDYDAIMKRYWHIEREPLIASLLAEARTNRTRCCGRNRS